MNKPYCGAINPGLDVRESSKLTLRSDSDTAMNLTHGDQEIA
jgi:hypothetical protein